MTASKILSRFAAFAPQLATALEATLVSNGEASVRLIRPDVELDVSVATYGTPGQLTIDLPVVRWQSNGNHHYATARDSMRSNEELTVSIGASMSRGAPAIAKDVTRRLLPGAREVWARMLERQRNALEYAGKTRATLEKLMELTGERANRGEQTLYVKGGVSLRAEGDTVTFTRLPGVTLETAGKILALLQADPERLY